MRLSPEPQITVNRAKKSSHSPPPVKNKVEKMHQPLFYRLRSHCKLVNLPSQKKIPRIKRQVENIKQ